jgi:glycosyltransferase involved in cell wall biosynthesis
MMPKVSVIVPNYRHAKFLPKRIQSILDQTFQDFELIILDDCSPDNSRDVINSFKGHEKVSAVVFNDKNTGSTFRQWEKGLSLSKGEYIWIAESDDFAHPDFLSRTAGILDSQKKVGVVNTNSFVVDDQNNIIETTDIYYNDLHQGRWNADFYSEGRTEVKYYLSQRCTIPNASAVLFRKNVLEKTELDSLNMTLAGDWMIYIKALLLSDLYYIHEPLNYFRAHTQTVRSRTNTMKSTWEAFSIFSFLKKSLPDAREQLKIRAAALLAESRIAVLDNLRVKAPLHSLSAIRSYLKIIKQLKRF